MRYARLEVDGQQRVAVVDSPPGDPALPETTHLRLFPAGTDLLDVAGARRVPDDTADTVDLGSARLLSPIQPATFRDFVAFEEHVQGASAMLPDPAAAMDAWAQAPAFVFGSPYAAIGPNEPVAAPAGSEMLDFELEVGVVIGRDGRDLTPAEARDHIAGYLIVNDWSARDLQRREMRGGLGPAKGKDFATTLGPWLVTPDELESVRIGDRLDLEMTVWVNGIEFGADTTAHMGWSFEELVSYASRSAWVRTGDVIASGTCGGGALAEAWGRSGTLQPPPLQPGDVVTMTVAQLGSLTTHIVAGTAQRSPIPRARPLAELRAALDAARRIST